MLMLSHSRISNREPIVSQRNYSIPVNRLAFLPASTAASATRLEKVDRMLGTAD